MGIWIASAALFLALCAGSAASAQKADQVGSNAGIVFGRWPKAGACTPENTLTVPLAELLRDRARHDDKCISTEGYLADRALFLSLEDSKRSLSNVIAMPADRRVGLYVREGTTYATAGDSRVRVIGKLWDCGRLHGPEVIMVVGYCHNTGGPIIGVSSFEPVN